MSPQRVRQGSGDLVFAFPSQHSSELKKGSGVPTHFLGRFVHVVLGVLGGLLTLGTCEVLCFRKTLSHRQLMRDLGLIRPPRSPINASKISSCRVATVPNCNYVRFVGSGGRGSRAGESCNP